MFWPSGYWVLLLIMRLALLVPMIVVAEWLEKRF
jgi:hypothetical protein